MFTFLFTFLGIACVAWTVFEVRRLSNAAVDPRLTSSPAGPGPKRFRRFAAWDDRGRPITVEDLGRS